MIPKKEAFQKKILVLFDLNKTLLYVNENKKTVTFENQQLMNYMKPDKTINNMGLYFRPGRPELLDFLFQKNRRHFDVGVWSSLDRDKTEFLTQQYFERYFRNLLFVTSTRREEYQGIQNRYGYEPISINRNLQGIFDKFPQFELSTTLVISTQPNMNENYIGNDIILPKYEPSSLGSSFDNDLTIHALYKFLMGVDIFIQQNKTQDVRQVIQNKSFESLYRRITNDNQAYTHFK